MSKSAIMEMKPRINTDVLYKAIGTKIAELRAKEKREVVDLARGIERKTTFVRDIEAGKAKITIADIYAIAIYFSIDIGDLLPSLTEPDKP